MNLQVEIFHLPGEGGISSLIVCHVTKSVRNRVKPIFFQVKNKGYWPIFKTKLKVEYLE